MAERVPSRVGRFRGREPKTPSERAWARSTVLEPRLGQREPQLVGDGAGLAFPPAALIVPPEPLDVEDGAVAALFARLSAGAAAHPASDGKRGTAPPATPLEGWRLLARTDDEALFGHGVPPALLTVAVRHDGRRRTWTCVASSAARSLRATRDGIRASSWRIDPTHDVQAGETMLRVLVTEQAFASGQRAHGRILAPDLYVDDELVLTIFVSPRPGFQTGARNPETPARVALPHAVGARRVIDGALAPARPRPAG